MRILVIYDGKAGHLSQALGAAQLIEDRLHGPVVIDQMIAKIRLKLLNRVIDHLAMLPGRVAKKLVSYFYTWTQPKDKPDLIISFGGNVIALNIALTKLWNCHNLAIGNLYSFNQKQLNAHITMRGEAGHPKVILSPVALCKTRQRTCQTKGKKLLQSLPEGRYWGMLIGGEGSGYHYQDSDWHRLGTAMQQLSQQHGIKWLLTTSRRSGIKAEQILMQYLDETTCAKAYLSSQLEDYSLEAILGGCERLFCSEDSLSMVTESVAVNKPVTTLIPTQVKHKTTHQKAVHYLAQTCLITRYQIANLKQFSPQPLEPLKPYSSHLDDIFAQLLTLLEDLEREHSNCSSWHYQHSLP